MILSSLTEIVKKKESALKFSQVSDLMYHFVNGGMSAANKNFIYFLEKVADDQLTLKEEFNTLNSTKLLWAYGKFMNRSLAPYFASQVSSSIINRYEFSRQPSVNHRLQRKAVKEILHQKKQISSENFALSLYACASVGFYEKEFFDNAVQQYQQSGEVPSVQNLGYIVQAVATLRKNEHVKLLVDWTAQLIEK